MDDNFEKQESEQANYDQILFPAVYELHRRGYDIRTISTEDDWEISITFDQIYRFVSLPSEHWMQCGQDLIYRHDPAVDRYDRKFGAFEVFGWACTLPPIHRPANVDDFYHGIVDSLMQSADNTHNGLKGWNTNTQKGSDFSHWGH